MSSITQDTLNLLSLERELATQQTHGQAPAELYERYLIAKRDLMRRFGEEVVQDLDAIQKAIDAYGEADREITQLRSAARTDSSRRACARSADAGGTLSQDN